MTRHKVIFTTERGHRHQQAVLNAAPESFDITMLRQPNLDELLPYLAETEYFISERTGVINADIIKAAPRLKLILRLGSMTHDIDTLAAQAAGVTVCYWPVGSVIRVAEHMVMQMLALGKKLREAEGVALQASTEWGLSKRTDEDTFAYNWSGRDNVEGLWRKTIGILGFGEIGAELARRLQGWDVRLLYHKRRRLPQSVEQELGLTYVDTEALLRESDYLNNLLPYFPATDMLINADYFNTMKKGAFVVSCGSGSVIDEAALAKAVTTGKLGGAALDTFEWEPIKADNPLIAAAHAGYNILLTPHTAAGASAAAARERSGDYTNILNHLQGNPIKYRVI
jgi:lactate dehydrogenase-like 2-hydroxyacid dehydrogenase